MNEQEPTQIDETAVQSTEFALRETPQAESIGAGWRWIKEGFALFKQSPGAWVGGMIVSFIIIVGVGLIPIIGQILNYFIGPIIMAGIVIGCTEQDSGGKFKFSHYFAGFSNNIGQLLLLGLLYLIGMILAVAIGIGIAFVGIGIDLAMMELLINPESTDALENFSLMPFVLTILFIMLFIIPLSMSIWFAPALIVNHNVGAFSAMMLSLQGSIKNILPFLWYSIVLFLLMLVAMIPLLLGLLVMAPVMYASIYTSYRGIFTE